METPSRFSFTLDGATRVFPIATTIKGDNYCRLEVDGTIINDRSKYDIVNNSIVFLDVADVPSGSQLDVLVVQSEEAIGQLTITTNIDIVASDIANINTVAEDIDNVNTVAGNIADVNRVATSADNLDRVHTSIDNLDRVDTSIDKLDRVYTSVDNLDRVFTSIDNLDRVDTSIDKLDRVYTSVDKLDRVYTSIDNVDAIQADITNVDTVAGSIAGVNTTSTNIANVNTVATNIGDIQTAAVNLSDISAVADEVAKVITVANDLTEATSEIDTVAASIDNVDTVGTNIANVNTVASNITDVNSFAETYFISATEPSSPTEGDLWFDTSSDTMKVYNGSSWQNAGSSVNGTSTRGDVVATEGQTTIATTGYDSGYLDVFLNGVKQVPTTDFTATDGVNIVFTSALTAGDEVSYIGFGTFELADVYTKTASDLRYYTKTESDANFMPIDAVTLPDQTGQSGNYLTTDGTDASWVDVPKANLATFVASGAISAGDCVVINEDGTVSKVSNSEVTIPESIPYRVAPIAENSGAQGLFSIDYDPFTSGRFLMMYRDSYYSSGAPWVVLCEQVGALVTIVGRFQISTERAVAAGMYGIRFDRVTPNKVVAVFMGQNTSDHHAVAGTISNNDITFGPLATFTYKFPYCNTKWDMDPFVTGRFIIGGAANELGSPDTIVVAGQVSGDTITFGSYAMVETNQSYDSVLRFNPDTPNQAIIWYLDYGGTNLECRTITLSGTTLTLGSVHTINSSNEVPVDVVFDPHTPNTFVLVSQPYSDYTTDIRVGTVSGTSFTYYATTQVSTTGFTFNIFSLCADPHNVNKFYGFRHEAEMEIYRFTKNGTTITLDSIEKPAFDGTFVPLAQSSTVVFDPNVAGMFLVPVQWGPYLNYMSLAICHLGGSLTTNNLTQDNFVGIADSSASDGENVTVTTQSGLNGNFTGLSIGASYYIQPDASVGTNPFNLNVSPGLAVSATEILVKG